MALQAKVGYLDVNPGVTNQDVTLGFQPKLGIFWGTDQAADGSSDTGIGRSFGFVDAAGGQAVISHVYTGANITKRCSLLSAFKTYVTGGTIVTDLRAPATWASDVANGFRLTRSTGAAAKRVNYLALGGSTIANTKVGKVAGRTTVGTLDINLGFTPTGLILISAHMTAESTNDAFYPDLSVGFASSVVDQACHGEAINSARSKQYFNSGQILALHRDPNTGNAPQVLAAVSAWGDLGGGVLGVRLNYTAATTVVHDLFYAAWDGTNCKVGKVTTTAVQDAVQAFAPGFPSAAVLSLAAPDKLAGATWQSGVGLSIGAGAKDGAAYPQRCIGGFGVDAGVSAWETDPLLVQDRTFRRLSLTGTDPSVTVQQTAANNAYDAFLLAIGDTVAIGYTEDQKDSAAAKDTESDGVTTAYTEPGADSATALDSVITEVASIGVRSFQADVGIQLLTLRVHKGNGASSVIGANDTIQHVYASDVDDWFHGVRFVLGDGTPVKHRRFNIVRGVSADFLLSLDFAGAGVTAVRMLVQTGAATASTDESVLLWGCDGWHRFNGHGVFRPHMGQEQTILYENGKYRCWFTWGWAVPGGGAPFNGGYADGGVAYTESADGETGWTAPVLLGVMGQFVHTGVAKGPDGTYYLIGTQAKSSGNQTPASLYSSPTGAPGTWTLLKADLIVNPDDPTFTRGYANGMGNTSFFWNEGKWYVFQEWQRADYGWSAGLWTGPDLLHLTPWGGTPTALNLGGAATVGRIKLFPKPGGGYFVTAHVTPDSPPIPTLPTHLAIYETPAPQGPFTLKGWALLIEPYFASVTGYTVDHGSRYNGTAVPDAWDTNKPYFVNAGIGEGSQLGDATIPHGLEDGTTRMFYESLINQYDQFSLAQAIWPSPLSDILDPVRTHARLDDLQAETWVHDVAHIDTYSGSGWTRWMRKRSRFVDVNPVAIELKGDVYARRAIAPGVDDVVLHLSLRGEQVNAQHLFAVEKAGNTKLVSVVMDSDGHLKLQHGAGTLDLGAYSAATYYRLRLTLRSTGLDAALDGTTVATGLTYQSAWARPAAYRVEQPSGEFHIGQLLLRKAPSGLEPQWAGVAYAVDYPDSAIGLETPFDAMAQGYVDQVKDVATGLETPSDSIGVTIAETGQDQATGIDSPSSTLAAQESEADRAQAVEKTEDELVSTDGSDSATASDTAGSTQVMAEAAADRAATVDVVVAGGVGAFEIPAYELVARRVAPWVSAVPVSAWVQAKDVPVYVRCGMSEEVVYQGDDRDIRFNLPETDADGQAIDYTNATLYCDVQVNGALVACDGFYIDPAARIARARFARAKTAAWPKGKVLEYDGRVKLASGLVRTVGSGTVTVKAPKTPTPT